MSKILSMCLFYSSFAPLWLSIIFIDVKSILENDRNIYTELLSIIIILIIMLICLIFMMMGFCMPSNSGKKEFVLVKVTEEKSITAEYLLSYILPLFAFDFTCWHGVVLFLIFFLTFGFLCIRHSYFSVNIILEIADFNFYHCELENEDGVIIEKKIVSRRKMCGLKGDTIKVKDLNNEYVIDLGM